MIQKLIFSLVLSSAVIVPSISASTCLDDELEEGRPIHPFRGTLNLAYIFKDRKTSFTKQEVLLPNSRIAFPVDVADAESGLVGLGVLLQGEHLQDEQDSFDDIGGMSKVYAGLSGDQTLNWDQILYKFPQSFLKPTVNIEFVQSEEFNSVIEMRMWVIDSSDFQYRSEPMLLDLDRDDNRVSDAVLQKYLTPEAVKASYCKEEYLPLDIGSCLMRPVVENGDELNGLSMSIKLLSLTTTHSRLLNFDFCQLPLIWQNEYELSSGYMGSVYPLMDRIQFVLEFRSKGNVCYELTPSDRRAFSMENHSIDYAYAGVVFFLNLQDSHMSLTVRTDSINIHNKGVFSPLSEVKTAFTQIGLKLPIFDEATIARYVDQETMGFKVIQRSDGLPHL